jgi:glucosylceramidase
MHDIKWIATTQASQWQSKDAATISLASESKWDVETQLEKTLQTIEGFGACFNELGWTSLSALPDDADRHAAEDAGCEQLQPQTY